METRAKRYCPTCHGLLDGNAAQGAISCSDCGGEFVSGAEVAELGTLRFQGKLPAASRPPECPGCAGDLICKLVPTVGRVGQCEGCGGLWLGPGRRARLEASLSGDQWARGHLAKQRRDGRLVWRALLTLSALSAAAAWLLSTRVL